jgi:ABC-type amino acid transport substrate-binding protein
VPVAQAETDARIATLRQARKIRVALYPPRSAKNQRDELRGWTIELARALTERIGVEFVPVEYPIMAFGC